MPPKFRFIFKFGAIWLALFLPHLAQASACCGGNFSGPALITGDDQNQFSPSLTYSRIDTDVESSGLWRKRSEPETVKSLSLQASHVFWDRWQAGLGIPVLQRSRGVFTESGIGDVSANLGYEYWNDWDYHPIRPKGIGYLQLIAPSGKSIDESDSRYQLDVQGRGFWALGIGTVLTKTFTRWDAFSSFDLHRSFEKNASTAQGPTRLKPGWGGSASLGAGFHFENFRLGSSLSWNYEDPVDTESATFSSEGSPQRFVTAAASLTWILENEWSFTAQYADQGLIGSPVNTTLSQSVSLQLQKRWLR
jgi:hypothetical protein